MHPQHAAEAAYNRHSSACLSPVSRRDTLHDQELSSRGVERFFRSGSQAGIQPKHAKRLRLQLGQLDAASGPADMNRPGWRCHPLKGRLDGH
jgi:proteic killer suppression protein